METNTTICEKCGGTMSKTDENIMKCEKCGYTTTINTGESSNHLDTILP